MNYLSTLSKNNKNVNKYFTIKCKWCDSQKDILIKEYKRQINNGRKPDEFFCNNSCSCSYKMSKTSDETKLLQGEYLTKWCKDNPELTNLPKFSAHSYYLNKCKQRSKATNKEFNLDLEYIENLWETSNGKCALSKIDITLRKTSYESADLWSASIDRIDSSKGYIKGNVQFVAYAINLAKSNKDDQILQFIEMIKNIK